jgi:hypothetical protein
MSREAFMAVGTRAAVVCYGRDKTGERDGGDDRIRTGE